MVRGERNCSYTGDFNGHFGDNPENYEDKHGDYGYGVRNKEGEKVFECCATLNMKVISTLQEEGKSPRHL